MIVGIDISSIVYKRGVSRYTANLVSQLAQRKDIELQLYGSSLRQSGELTAFAKHLNQERVFANKDIPTFFQKFSPKMMELLWNTFGLNKIKKLMPQVSVFHSWDWLQPPDKKLPIVSTIHDLAILRYPETAHPKILKLHQQSWKRLKEANAEIIAVSLATKKDCIDLLQLPPEKVHVIYEALPKEVIKTAETLDDETYQNIQKKFSLEKPYILFVGTREPRKNLENLILAWQKLDKDVDLLIAGEEGWDDSESIKGEKTPRFLGKVSDEELTVLYSEAELFAYPSLYEGFGLPILEAFYHGVPVLTSNVSSMPEVAGNAAVLIDPLSVKSIAAGLRGLLEEDREAQQKRMQRMIIRLQLFSWRKAADETVKVYRKAAESLV